MEKNVFKFDGNYTWELGIKKYIKYCVNCKRKLVLVEREDYYLPVCEKCRHKLIAEMLIKTNKEMDIIIKGSDII